MPKKTLTFALMDAPYESANLTTAFRILDAAAKRGHDINVFAYEGAAALAFTRQSPHPNPVHGKNLAEENHPTTKDQVAALLAGAGKNGGKVDWVNCGMCVDERGVNEFVPGTRRGSPADFQAFIDMQTRRCSMIPWPWPASLCRDHESVVGCVKRAWDEHVAPKVSGR